MDFNELKLKDNISQFIEINKGKTNIDRSKLSEFVDIEISELTPITFTYLLEKYKKFKNQVPFY